MKTLLLFLILKTGSIDLACDNFFLPAQKIDVVETVLSDYYGTAFVDFNGWVYEIYCTEDGYIYDGQNYLTISDLLKHQNRLRNNKN